MTPGNGNPTVARARNDFVVAEPAVSPSRRYLIAPGQSARQINFLPAGTKFGPTASLVGAIGGLAVGACIAPWFGHGWRWFVLIATAAALLACYDALALWLSRNNCVPTLLASPKGLRGREGQTINIPLAISCVGGSRPPSEVRVGIMPATEESETAIFAKSAPERMKLQRSDTEENLSASSARPQRSLRLKVFLRQSKEESPSTCPAPTHLWPWTPEIALLRRGLWPGPRVGVERRSRVSMWRLQQWFDSPEPLRIEADLRAGRSELLRSPVYRALVAAQQTPWTGHGRDFERLREYQPGDTYSEIAWKSTARRNSPVTRLFQWEQKQEVYFVLDQSRAAALAIDPHTSEEGRRSETRAPRRLLDLAVETALVGATVALELGDEFGLVTYADEPKSWLRAGSGQAQFHEFRDRLLSIDPLPTTADYETLFSEIRVRLRRRAYLVVLADLTERSVSDSLRRGIGLVRSSHALLMNSILPPHARPAFSPGETLHTGHDVYAALAAEKENQRLASMARQLSHLGVQLRYIPAEKFLRTAVEGYLESKREQRL